MHLLLGILAATLLFALPLAAQPAPEALVDSVVAALRADEQAGSALGLFQGQFLGGVAEPSTLCDSVTASFRADLRPDLLRDALAYLQTPSHTRLLGRTIEVQPSLDLLVPAAFGYPPDLGGPKKGTLADSALAARYVDARGAAQTSIALMERVIRAVVAAEPAAATDIEEGGTTLEEGIASTLKTMATQLAPLSVARARFALAGLPPRDVQAEIAFQESPAGQYVTERLDRGLVAAVFPAFTARLLEQYRTSQAAPPPPPAARRPLSKP